MATNGIVSKKIRSVGLLVCAWPIPAPSPSKRDIKLGYINFEAVNPFPVDEGLRGVEGKALGEPNPYTQLSELTLPHRIICPDRTDTKR